MLVASVSPAAPAPAVAAKSASSSKLKWRSKSAVTPAVAVEPVPVETKAGKRQDEPKDPPKAVRKAVLTERAASTKSSRARLRDAIMQVSGIEDESVSSTTPAEGENENSESTEAETPLTAQRNSLSEPGEALPPNTSAEPAQLSPADPFAEDSVPTPPAEETPAAAPPAEAPPTADAPPALGPSRSASPDPLPPSDLSEGISTSSPANCNDYEDECRRAIRELLKRDITTIQVGLEITGVEGEDFPCDCKAGSGLLDPSLTTFTGRNWCRTNFAWKATGLCHKPLYFEDVQLERYGHSWNPVLQPFMSAGHFFASVALLPYHMGINPPGECIYTLGYYRPGSCAPYMIEPFPISLRGAVFEAAAVTGFYFWLYP